MTKDFFRSLSYAAEADGVAGEAGVGKAWVFAEAVGRAQGIRAGIPRPATKNILLAVGGTARIACRTGGVVVGVIDVVAPLGHVAVHVEQSPGVGSFLADRMCLLRGIVGEPGIV